jgi:hypothetical protein
MEKLASDVWRIDPASEKRWSRSETVFSTPKTIVEKTKTMVCKVLSIAYSGIRDSITTHQSLRTKFRIQPSSGSSSWN